MSSRSRVLVSFMVALFMSFTWASILMPARSWAAPASFVDVPPGSQFFDHIEWLAAETISTGWAQPDGTTQFRPLESVHRDAMAAFLYRLAGAPAYSPPDVSPFLDVTPSTQFYAEICWLSEQQISKGWPDGTFRPLDSVNRDAMAAFLYRFAGSPSFTSPSTSPFADVPPGTQFYQEMAWLADSAISTGWTESDGSRTYRPLTPVARDAMAAFLYRLNAMLVGPSVGFEARWQSDPLDVSVMAGTKASFPLVLGMTGPTTEVGLTLGGELANVATVDATPLGGDRFKVMLTVSVPVQHEAKYPGTVQVTHRGQAEGNPLAVLINVTVPDAVTIPSGASTPTPDRTGQLAGSPVVTDELIVTIREGVGDPEAMIRQLAAAHGAVLVGSVASARIYELRFPGAVVGDLTTLRDTISASSDVEQVMLALLGSSDATVNDPKLTGDWSMDGTSGTNWALKMIKAPEAWDSTTGAGVPVAVIDVGFDTSHEDLVNRIVSSAGYGDNPAHGTHVAGTICAEGNNGLGISGVAYDCSLSAYAVMEKATKIDNLVEVMHSAATAEPAPRVVNISMGWGTSFDCTAVKPWSEEQALQYAAVQAGSRALAAEAARHPEILWVVAAGNEGRDAACSAMGQLGWGVPNVVSVASVDDVGNLAATSNRGERVTVAAPGVGILSTRPRSCDRLGIFCGPDRYEVMSGTSMAAPHVTGIAALAFAANPALTATQARTCLIRPDSSGGIPVAGQPFTIVDAAATVRCAKSPSALQPLRITTTTLPVATTISGYSAQLSASGGFPTYEWGNLIGDTPLWVEVTGDGRLSFRTQDPLGGTYQINPGTYPVEVMVTDSTGMHATSRLSLVVSAVGPTTTLVSVANDGTPANSTTETPAISTDGRYVSYASWASNLVPGDTNDGPDVFVWDRDTGSTTIVSVAPDGSPATSFDINRYGSANPAISADGRYIAYESDAWNLVPGDANGTSDVFVWDRLTDTTRIVSVATDGTQGDRGSYSPAISADGRYVTYTSDAWNLIPGDTNVAPDVFLWDREADTTTLVSTAPDAASWHSTNPAISADGRFVTYQSLDAWVGGPSRVLLWDRDTRTTTQVSLSTDDAGGPTISGNGRYITFESEARVHLWDRDTAATTVLPLPPDALATHRPAISADGSFITYEVASSPRSNVVLWNRVTGVTRLSYGASPAISADGRYVTYLDHLDSDYNSSQVFLTTNPSLR